MTGKCPKCGSFVTRVQIHGVDAASTFGGPTWKAITYNCVMCQSVLGVAIDPIAIKSDTVDQVVEEVVKRLRR